MLIIYTGTHWIFEIVSLIVNEGDPSKIERSHMVTGLEVSLGSLDLKTAFDLEAIAKEKVGYEAVDGWTSPRVIPTHLNERHFPPDVWKRKAKVTERTLTNARTCREGVT